MDKIILQAKNRRELDEMLKRTITLNNDETYNVIVVKEPKKILFFETKGIYEVEIIKKGENSVKATTFNNENLQVKKEVKQDFKREEKVKENLKENRFEQVKNENKKLENNKNVNNRENIEKESRVSENIQNIEKNQNRNDFNIDRIRSFMKEFIVNTKLDISIVNIEKVSDRYVVNLDGKDMRYLIGEKGSSLNSVEYLLSSVKALKNLKVVIDSNDYKAKREESLRDLARKKGKKVFDSGKSLKLNPMSARERKIIHEEISFMKGLKTESVGEEPKRYLVIKKVTEKN